MQKYQFRWTSSYMGVVEYHVFGDGERYTVSLRTMASDYEKSIYNHGSPLADWQRDVVAAIDLLHRKDSRYSISQDVVDAFNAWRASEHARELATISGNPAKYGEVAANDPVRTPPRPVRGAFYRCGDGWVVNS
jgi:hypothetical protein